MLTIVFHFFCLEPTLFILWIRYAIKQATLKLRMMIKIYLVVLFFGLMWSPQMGKAQLNTKTRPIPIDLTVLSGSGFAYNPERTISINLWATNREILPETDFSYIRIQEKGVYKSIGNVGAKKIVNHHGAAVLTNVNLPTDYFRSYIDGGEWDIPGNWEFSPDNGITPWVIATLVPDKNAEGIVIRNGYNIYSSGTVTADDITIATGAALTIYGGSFTITDGAAPVDLQVNGNLTWSDGIFITTGAGVSFEATSTYLHAISFAGEIPAAAWKPSATCIVTGMTTSSTAPTGLNQLFGNFTWNCNQTSSDDYVLINNNLFGVTGTLAINHTGAAYFAFMGATTASFTNTIHNIEVKNGTLLLNNYNTGGGYAILNVTGDITVANVSTAKLDFAAGAGNSPGTGYIATLHLAGSLTVGANAYFSRSNASINTSSALFFNGTAGTQEVNIGYGSSTSRGRIIYHVNAGAVVQLKNNLWMWDADSMYVFGTINTLGYSIANTVGAANTAFYSFPGSTLITSLFNGFTATGSGGVQTNTRVYSSAANYEFRGVNTGDFTTITTPAPGTVRDLTINYFGVNMTGNITVTGALKLLTGGQFRLPAFSTLTLAGTLPAPAGTIDAFSSGPSTIVLANAGFTINNLLFSPSGNLYYLNNNPPSGINTLQGDFIIARALTLSGGILDNGNNSLTLGGIGGTEEPLVKINGTITMDSGSSLTFGSGNSNVTIPDDVFTSGPKFANLKLSRGNGRTVTLGNQGMELFTGLYLRRGTLNIGNSLLNLNGAYLDNSGTPGGYLAGSSTADLTVTGNTGGKVTIPLPDFTDISLRTVTVSGGRTLAMASTPLNNINLFGTMSIETQGTYDNGGESQLINAGAAAIYIDGTFITKDVQGFTGTNAAIPAINPVLNPDCTIEYGYTGDQAISIRTDYKNIRFTGGGIKKHVTANDIAPIAGTVIIPDATTVNTEGNIFGSAATNFTMFNGRFISSGPGSKPDMNGTYNLFGGIVEFAGSQITGQNIQSLKPYINIEVTGNNVGKDTGDITIKNTGSFIVKSNGIFTINEDAIIGPIGAQRVVVETDATFKCGNVTGFNGGTNTSIKSNIETITLNAGSTLEYARNIGNGNQIVTSGITYQQVIMSGLGVKNLTTGTFALSNSGWLDIKAPVAFDAENGTTIDFNNRPVQIRSTVAGTASLGNLTGVTINNAGDKFSVERFIPERRAWRLITAPLLKTGSTTISAVWQNGKQSADRLNPVIGSNGIGTSITNGIIAANGYDAGSTPNASLKYFNAGNWVAPLATTIPVSTYPGYMLFVRGDRQIIISNQFVTPNATTLIPKGSINFGTQNPITSTGFRVVGNPYPSAIDFKKLIKSGGLEDKYYLWDPKQAGFMGVGAFVSFLRNGSTYDQTLLASDGSSIQPSIGTLPNDGTIESGAAFMIDFGTTGTATLQLDESAKINTSASAPFGRPANPFASNQSSLRTNLAAFNSDSSLFLVDGVLATFNAAYNNDVDVNDAVKIKSFAENVALLTNGQQIAIERRKLLTQNDTIFLQLSGLRVRKYRLELEAKGIANENLAGYFEDTYLSTSKAINMEGFTSNDFMPQNIPASGVPYRFRIVFKKSVSYNTIKVYRLNNAVAIDWSVTGERDIRQYEIERSTDGVNFTAISIKLAKADNSEVNYYNGLDEGVLAAGVYYYRIKGTSNHGAIGYSNLAKVTIMNERGNMYVYPNPASNGSMGLQMNSMPAGIYNLRLLNLAGQILFNKTINHGGGTASFTISYPPQLKGNAELEITGVDKKKTVLKVIVQ